MDKHVCLITSNISLLRQQSGWKSESMVVPKDGSRPIQCLLFCCLVAKLCLTLCDPMDCNTPSFPVLHHLPELAQSHVYWVGDAIQPSCPLSSPSPPAFNLSQHQGLSNESALCIMWPKYWSFSSSISTSNEYAGLISFRIDWFDLLAIQETLKNFLQHHNLKTSVLRRSAFFMVHLSHLYMTTGKTTALILHRGLFKHYQCPEGWCKRV